MTALDGGDWIRNFRLAPDHAATLVCLPHAGGSASFYFPLARALAPDIEVIGVQYPGRQERRMEACVEEIPVLADRIAEALQGWAGRDIALFGHSMGASVGFEVARRLERDASLGPSPIRLIVSARRAPSIPTTTSVHRRDDDGLIAELRRLSGTDASLFSDDELLRTLIPMIRADYKAIESYSCPDGVRLKCPVTAFVGAADPVTSLDQVMAWSQHTDSEFGMRVFPGGHFYLTDWDAAIVSEVRKCLGRGFTASAGHVDHQRG
jgi:surfactin synthase thioesterase subunit